MATDQADQTNYLCLGPLLDSHGSTSAPGNLLVRIHQACPTISFSFILSSFYFSTYIHFSIALFQAFPVSFSVTAHLLSSYVLLSEHFNYWYFPYLIFMVDFYQYINLCNLAKENKLSYPLSPSKINSNKQLLINRLTIVLVYNSPSYSRSSYSLKFTFVLS